MRLKKIYLPIQKELKDVEDTIQDSLSRAKNPAILEVNRFLLASPGKRLRPAMVLLSARAADGRRLSSLSPQLIKIASAIELIHMASLVHDDVIDHSRRRHNSDTVNVRWGMDTSIALGDYLHSLAFKLIADCDKPDILACLSSATQAMCEGELIQLLERDNLSLLKERYLLIIKKKTASLFAASCQAGAIASSSGIALQSALRDFGLNFGIAFQIIDDYRDLTASEEALGKEPGQDIAVGEATLPLLNLLKFLNRQERLRLTGLFKSKEPQALSLIKKELAKRGALSYTKKISLSYINCAKNKLKSVSDSRYRRSLLDLSDMVLESGI